MSRYDYGLRGPRDTTEPRLRRRDPRDHGGDFEPYAARRSPRVTARYNRDYVREAGDRYPVDDARFGGEWRGRIGGEEGYRRPYMTRGGTWTHRGVEPPPPPYDRRDFGPDYGGRYPDEL